MNRGRGELVGGVWPQPDPTHHPWDPCSRDGTTKLPPPSLQGGLPFLSLHPWVIGYGLPQEGRTSHASLDTGTPIGYSLETGGRSYGLLAATPPAAGGPT